MYSLYTLCVIGILSVTVRFAASQCNDNGMRKSDGTCKCNPDFYGKNCECSLMYGLPEEACISPNSTIPCSGRGDCVCGMCECHKRRAQSTERYSGEYCQCDECPYENNRMCGGNGRCACGRCICDEGFSGDACYIMEGSANCIAPNSDKICNGQGLCVYGACQCNKEGNFKGPYCEECPTCPGQCAKSYQCAWCKVENYGNCSEVCGTASVMMVDILDFPNGLEGQRCLFHNPFNTLIKFTYTYQGGKTQLKVLRQKGERVDASSSSSCITYSYYLTLLVAATMLG